MADDDIERRLTSVETAVERLREQQELTASDAGAARVLAAGADRDVSEVRSELRAHTSALNALRETQVEHGHRLDRLDHKVDTGFAQVDARFAQVDENFATVAAQFASVQAGLRQIVGLLERP